MAQVMGCLGAALDEHSEDVLRPSVLEAAISALRASRDSDCERGALDIYALVDEDPAQRDAVREAGGIEHLIALASKGSDGRDGGSKIAALKALALVAHRSKANKIHIAKNEGINVIVAAVGRGSNEARKAAAAALCALSTDAENKAAIARAGGIKLLLKLAESRPTVECARFAVATLRNLSADDEHNKSALATTQAVATLARLIEEARAGRDDNVAEEAAATLANVARTKDDDHRLQLASAIAPLVKVTSSSDFKPPCRAQAAGALAELSCSAENRARIVAMDGHEAVVHLVISGPASCKREATCALRNLTAANDEHAREAAVACRRTIAALVRLIEYASEEIRASAAATLRNLTVLDNAATRVVNAGAIGAIARVVAHENNELLPATVEMMALLRNIAYHSEHRGPIGATDLIPRLVSMIHAAAENHDVLELVLATLANVVAKNSANQEAFSQASGPEVLQRIVQSDRTTTIGRQHAIRAIGNLETTSQTKAAQPPASTLARDGSSGRGHHSNIGGDRWLSSLITSGEYGDGVSPRCLAQDLEDASLGELASGSKLGTEDEDDASDTWGKIHIESDIDVHLL